MNTRYRLVSTSRSAPRAMERGAAMVEALVVIPFFLTIFASLVFIYQLYSSKLQTQRDSMEKAWHAAIEGCGEAEDGSGPLPGTENIDLGAAAAIPGTQLCDTGFGIVPITERRSATASPLIGAFTKDTSTETVLLCNEKPVGGDFDGAADYLWAILEEPELLQ